MDVVWSNIDWKWDDPHKPSELAVKEATFLLKATMEAGIPPESARVGKFPTVRFFWEGGRIEVEVFSESFDLYYLPRFEEKESYSITEFEASSPDTLSKLVSEVSGMLSNSRA